MKQPFDPIRAEYDKWYDRPVGQAVFGAEIACIRQACGGFAGRWLEIGVGTGRFASALGIGEGIDPAPRMSELAARRGVQTYTGQAEDLPFAEGSFDGTLLALTLCFIVNPSLALRECHRVLRPGGSLILGIVPADSPWGVAYARKKAEGHPVYVLARLQTVAETVALAAAVGFGVQRMASTLLWKPEEIPEAAPRVEAGIATGAGFVAINLGLLGRLGPSDNA